MVLAGLLAPAAANAHALSPVHYPLGPYPFVLPTELWQAAFILPVNILTGVLIMWAFCRKQGFWGNLWRWAMMYIVSQGMQTAILFFPPLIFAYAGWSSGSEAFTSMILLLCFGILGAFIVSLILYKRRAASGEKLFLCVAVSVIAGYIAAYATGIVALLLEDGLWGFRHVVFY